MVLLSFAAVVSLNRSYEGPIQAVQVILNIPAVSLGILGIYGFIGKKTIRQLRIPLALTLGHVLLLFAAELLIFILISSISFGG